MGNSAHDHDSLNRKSEGRSMDLRYVGDEAGSLTRRIAPERFAGEQDLARMRPDEAQQGFEQRGFSASVGAKQCQHFATGQRDAQLPSDNTARIADGQVLGVQDHCACSAWKSPAFTPGKMLG